MTWNPTRVALAIGASLIGLVLALGGLAQSIYHAGETHDAISSGQILEISRAAAIGAVNARLPQLHQGLQESYRGRAPHLASNSPYCQLDNVTFQTNEFPDDTGGRLQDRTWLPTITRTDPYGGGTNVNNTTFLTYDNKIDTQGGVLIWDQKLSHVAIAAVNYNRGIIGTWYPRSGHKLMLPDWLQNYGDYSLYLTGYSPTEGSNPESEFTPGCDQWRQDLVDLAA